MNLEKLNDVKTVQPYFKHFKNIKVLDPDDATVTGT